MAVWIAFGVGVLILLVYALPKVIAWATSHFVVTSDRIIHRQGFIAKSSMEVPLEALNDVRFQQSVLERMIGAGDLILGAVGMLQFDVVQSRLQGEYGVDAMFEGSAVNTARWVTCDDAKIFADFQKALSHNLAIDAAGNLAYLAPNNVNLKLTQERWPKVVFHTTREHAVKL